jgi:hypothetical protein
MVIDLCLCKITHRGHLELRLLMWPDQRQAPDAWESGGKTIKFTKPRRQCHQKLVPHCKQVVEVGMLFP